MERGSETDNIRGRSLRCHMAEMEGDSGDLRSIKAVKK